MDSSSPVHRSTKGDWYFVHLLASYAILTIFLLFGLLVLLTAGAQPTEVPAVVRGMGAGGVIAVFWFWVRMLVDFFRKRPAKHPVAWGWALVLGAYVGAIAYFFLVWRPRHQAGDA